MIMRRQSFRRWFVSALVLGGCLTTLAVVSGGRAGSVSSSTFDVFVQPPFLTVGAAGFVKGEFDAASGPKSGTATHVVMTLDLPVALLNPTSSNCPPSASPVAGFNRFTCDIGTVKAGNKATRFVTFTAPSTAGTHTVNGSVTFDNGSTGAGVGGQNTTLTQSGQTTVVASTDTTRAGNCTGSASTPPASHHDPQSTAVTGATAASSSGLPCTWVFVGEDPAGASGLLTPISIVGLPLTTSPATVVITFFALPVPFSQFDLFYLPNYPNGPNPLASVPLVGCVGGALPPNETACLLSLVPLGTGAQATILLQGLDGDPGFGGG